MFATIAIEPKGNRFACKYNPENKAAALRELENMGHGVIVLRPADDENWDHNPEWEYYPGIGWVA
jgi:hypothetical protein